MSLKVGPASTPPLLDVDPLPVLLEVLLVLLEVDPLLVLLEVDPLLVPLEVDPLLVLLEALLDVGAPPMPPEALPVLLDAVASPVLLLDVDSPPVPLECPPETTVIPHPIGAMTTATA